MRLFTLLVALATVGDTFAQCNGASCLVPPSRSVRYYQPVAVPETSIPQADHGEGYRWESDRTDSRYQYLYLNGKQVGTLHPEGYRRLLSSGGFSAVESAPFAEPVARVFKASTPVGAIGEEIPPNGVQSDKIREAPEWSQNGTPITKTDAYAILSGGYKGNLIDDSKTLRLVAVVDKPTQDRLQSDWLNSPSLAAFRDHVLLQTYDPTDWRVQRVGYAPGLSLVEPRDNGKAAVLMRVNYESAPKLADALRVKDPLYDPSKDPDPSKPAPKPVPVPSPVPAPNPDPVPAPAPVVPQNPYVFWGILSAFAAFLLRPQIWAIVSFLLARFSPAGPISPDALKTVLDELKELKEQINKKPA
jgi:hypothetical protein